MTRLKDKHGKFVVVNPEVWTTERIKKGETLPGYRGFPGVRGTIQFKRTPQEEVIHRELSKSPLAALELYGLGSGPRIPDKLDYQLVKHTLPTVRTILRDDTLPDPNTESQLVTKLVELAIWKTVFGPKTHVVTSGLPDGLVLGRLKAYLQSLPYAFQPGMQMFNNEWCMTTGGTRLTATRMPDAYVRGFKDPLIVLFNAQTTRTVVIERLVNQLSNLSRLWVHVAGNVSEETATILQLPAHV